MASSRLLLLAACAALLLGVCVQETRAWGSPAPPPSESECRPYIEKALKEMEHHEAPAGSTEGGSAETEEQGDQPGDSREDSGDVVATAEGIDGESVEEGEEGQADSQAGDEDRSGEATEGGDSKEATEEAADSKEEGAEGDSKEEGAEGDSKEEAADGDSKEEAADGDSKEEDAERDSNEEGGEGDSKEEGGEGDSKEEGAEGDSKEEGAEGDSKEEAEGNSKEEEADGEASVEAGGESKEESEGDSKEEAVESVETEQEGESKEEAGDSVEAEQEGESKEEAGESVEADQDGDSKEEAGESVEADQDGDSKEEAGESVETEQEDSKEAGESVEADQEGESKEDAGESVEAGQEGESKEDGADSKEDTTEAGDSKEDTAEAGDSKEDAAKGGDSEEKGAESVEGDSKEEEKEAESKEEAAGESKEEPEDSKEDKSSEEPTATAESAEQQEAEPESGEKSEAEGESEELPEEDLTMELDIPENLRPREHISHILKLDKESVETEGTLEKVTDATLRELKRLYDTAIKPLEMLYKYRDLSNRHFGDPEIFSKPLILFMGPWSGGKSTIINYLTDNEYRQNSLRTGAEPSPAYFNILMHGERNEILDGTQLAADWTFSGLQKFGQGLLDRLRGVKLNNPLLEKVNIVEIPGILEIRKQVERMFPFNDACQWFIDRADIIFLVYDPSKLDVGPETEAILDQLKGREYQTRIILNKADQVKPEELMRVQGTLIWNISPLMSSAEPPIMYSTSLWSMPYESGAPIRLLQAQEHAFLRDLREAITKRVENKIASARRFAVRVRNHAKMVDCYLTTYYNHKSFFGNKKKTADDIIEHPQDYHIYEGLSTLTNISRYDLPDPETYRDFFKLNPLFEFQQLAATCTYFRGCPINRLDVAIAYDLPELVGKYKKNVEDALEQHQKNQPKS